MADILIIDDEQQISAIVRKFLELEGHVVREVTNPHDARDAIRQRRPALIFLDIAMPMENGVQFCKYLKSSTKYRDIPVVLLSAHLDMATFLMESEYAADAYIQKPFEAKELVDMARKLTGGK